MQGSGYRTPEKTSYNAAGHLTETADNPLNVIKNDLLKALSYDGKGNGMSPQRASESTTTLFKIVSVGCTDMLTDEIVKTKDKVKNQLEELKQREESKQRDNPLEIDHYEHNDNTSLTEAELEAIPLYKELGLLYKELEQIENIWKLRKANTTGGLVHMGAILRSGELRENKDLLLKSELLPIILSKDIARFSCLLTYFKTTITDDLIQEVLMKKEFLSLEELKQGDDHLDNYDDANESFVQKTQKCRETIESFITANAEIIINLAIGITSNSTYKENIKHINLDDTQPISEYLKLIESDLFNKVIKLPLFNAAVEEAIKIQTITPPIAIPAPIIKLALQSITAEDLTKIKNLLEIEAITTEKKIFAIIDFISSNPDIKAALQNEQLKNQIADFATGQIIEKLNVNFNELGGKENLKAICHRCIVHLGPVIGSDTNVANVKAALSMLIGGIEGEAGINAFSKIILKLFRDVPGLNQNQDLITKAGNLIGAIARDKVRTDAIDKEYIGAIATEFLTHSLPQITTPDIYAQTEQALDNLFRKKYHDFIINVIAIARLNQGFRDAMTNDTNGITTATFKLLLPLLTQAGMPQEQHATYEKVTIAAMTHIGALLSDEDNQALIDLVNSSKKDEHGSIDKKQLAVNFISLIQTAPGLPAALASIDNTETAIKTKLDVHIDIPAPIIKLALQSITAEDMTKLKSLLKREAITTEQKIFTIIDVVSSNLGIQAALQDHHQLNQIAVFATDQIIEKLNVNFDVLGGKENLKGICHHCISHLVPVIGDEANVANVKAALSMLIRGIEGEAGVNAFSKIILELFRDVPGLNQNQDLITKADNLIGAIARDKVRTDAIDKEYIGAIATEFLTH
ncbi:MAG: hypothetical protein HON78_00210, partial [Legionellales bacterium]|nr:hypothetical protein [Legionellales bacterium]